MRIFSKFHDYYDVCLKFGIDNHCVYKRENTEGKIESSHLESQYKKPWHIVGDRYSIHRYMLGFCGQLYSICEIHNKYFYSLEQIDKYLNSLPKEVCLEGDSGWYITRDKIIDWFNDYPRYGKSHRENCVKFYGVDWKLDWVFKQYKVPIFLISYFNRFYQDGIGYYKLELNPELKKYNFVSMKDPYTAFQEIEQYIGNNFFIEKPIPSISNNDMIESKGFNKKTSFRKEKRK